MAEIALRVQALGKRYRIGQLEPYQSLRDVVMSSLTRPWQRLRAAHSAQQAAARTIWALKDVSLTVKHGEVVGVIGRNGAGKSTLLKILSRITEPTTGRVEGYGRVGSLLEVGTGFHPELTGRENIFLNGAILGMRRAEIERKFDEIVTFAEIEQFLDTPVKRYSSGMYVRLAFAVAAHLEPEILIVDEVLAVGDAAFQMKCLGKMGTVAREGRTVLFVSHNMAAVQDLCSRAVWLDQGKLLHDGPTGPIVSRYLQTSFTAATTRRWENRDEAPGNDLVRIHSATVRRVAGAALEPITVQTPFVLEIEYWNLKPNSYLNINLQVQNEQGVVVFEAGPIREPIWRPLPGGLLRDVCAIPGNLLNDGMYRVTVQAVANQGTLVHQEDDILVFSVQDSLELREGWYGKWAGVVRPVLDWRRQLVATEQGQVNDNDPAWSDA